MKFFHIFILLGVLTCAGAVRNANAGQVTYSTTSSQLCVGAPGCGVSTQTIGGAVTVSFSPVFSSTVNAAPNSFASFGEITISCVGGGTACGSQSLAGVNLFINITQTVPTSGNASIAGGVISGSLSGNASSATITWATSNAVNIGNVTYGILNNSLGLVPPSMNGGVTTIQANIRSPGAQVTYNTNPSQLCFGATGCGVASQTIGGAVNVAYFPVSSSTVNPSPSTSSSLGRLVISCVGGGTACASQSLAGLNLFINISQSAPSFGNASMPGGAISGSISGTASSAQINWSTSNQVTIGNVSYRVSDFNTSISLLPPSVNNGDVPIPATIAVAIGPSLAYSPSSTQTLVLQASSAAGATGAIAIASSGASASGTTTVNGCALTVANGVFDPVSTSPSNGAFGVSITTGSINLSCQRSSAITSARLTCNEIASPGGSNMTNTWQIICPSIGAQGVDIDGNGVYSPTTDGLLIARYLLGMRGTALINNAIGTNATRTSVSAIEAYLQAVTQ